jgi:hypothetical protein
MTFTLAQILTDSPVPRLPDPPALAHYFLESPWFAVVGLVLGGALALIVLNRQGRAGLGAGMMLAGFALAAMVAVVALLVETQRELLIRQTRELVARTAAADTAALGPMLSDRVSFSSSLPLGQALPVDKESLLDSVRTNLGQSYRIAEHSTGGEQATIDGANTARTQLRVWVELNRDQAITGAPIGSWWRIDWRLEGDQWRVSGLTLMQLDGLGVGSR